MAVYFKFKSAKDSDVVSVDGNFISVANLKDKIVEKKKLRRGSDYDLVISNAQSNEDYTDQEILVPKNSSVLVRRVPRPTVPIVVRDEQVSALEAPPVNMVLRKFASPRKSSLQSVLDEVDDFGIDLYAVPEVVPTPVQSHSEDNEDSKIRAMVGASALDWQRGTEDRYPGEKGHGKDRDGGEYGRGFRNKIPHEGYVCHRCGIAGHFIQDCPTNGDPSYDKKKVKPPTGIPKTMLIPDSEGTYFLPTGQVAVLKPNETVFEREVDFLPSSGRQIDIPPELRCPLCKDVLKDAVLTSKCCFKSYCDKCIRDEIISKAKCACGATNILADDLLPNRTLRDAINRLTESQVTSFTSSGNVSTITSSGNAGTRASAPVMESSYTDSKEPIAGGKGQVRQALKPQVSIVLNGRRPEVELGDSSESQLKESVEEMVNPERRVSVDAKLRDKQEPVKGKKKRKVKGDPLVDLFIQDPNYNRSHIENCCMHCGSYEHPSWNCSMVSGSGPLHHPPAMQGQMFGPGFNPQMMGVMHQPSGEGPMIPYHQHNPGPYNAYGGPSPYGFQFNGPMVPPREPFIPHNGMMPYGAPQHMQWGPFDPTLVNGDEFGPRNAELERKREREQEEYYVGTELRSHPDGDQRRSSGARPYRSREDGKEGKGREGFKSRANGSAGQRRSASGYDSEVGRPSRATDEGYEALDHKVHRVKRIRSVVSQAL